MNRANESPTIGQMLKNAFEHRKMGRWKESEAIYRSVLKRVPTDGNALNGLGMIALETGRKKSALELLQQAAVADPMMAEVHQNLGIILALDKRWKEAIGPLRRALDLKPGLPTGLRALGDALKAEKRVLEAIQVYRR